MNVKPAHLKNAVKAVAAKLACREDVLWCDHSERELWAELVGCILSSQVRYEMCSAAYERLLNTGLLDPGKYIERDNHEKLKQALSAPFHSSDNASCFKGRYRFPSTKSAQIAETARILYKEGKGLSLILANALDAKIARRSLISVCKGIGPKQASMFLRNIGFTDDLAVLDRHIVRYMQLMGILEPQILPLVSLRRYELGELLFSSHAVEYGLSVGTLDCAVWVVMREIPGSKAQCQS